MLYGYLFYCVFLILPLAAHPLDYRVLASMTAQSIEISTATSAAAPASTVTDAEETNISLVEVSMTASAAAPVVTAADVNNTNTFNISGLLKGNEQFRQQRSDLSAVLAEPPGVMFIGCSDNRLSADTVFQTNTGSTMSHLNLANQFTGKDPGSNAALSYAVNDLHIQHIVVLGHFGCKSVHTAMSLQPLDRFMQTWLQPVADLFSRSKRSEIKKLRNARIGHDKAGAAAAIEDASRALVEENVKATVHNVQNLSRMYRKDVFVYGLVLTDTGEVQDLGVSSGPPGKSVPSLPLEMIPAAQRHNSFGKWKPKAKKLEPASPPEDSQLASEGLTISNLLSLAFGSMFPTLRASMP